MFSVVFPNISHQDRYIAMIGEWQDFEITPTSPTRLFAGENYTEFIQIIETDRSIGRLPGVLVSLLFFMEDENMLGAFSIWHHTNHPDFQAGGRSYISYGLRPSARDKGYTKEMLRLGLIEATKLGIKKVVISADEDNPVSWKTIESCGGILQKIIIKDEKKMKIYHLLIY